MAEGLEAVLAVVGAHAAWANATKGQVGVGNVEEGVIDAHAARGGGARHLLLDAGGLGEDVERQGLGAGVDKGDGLLDALDRDHWQQGAKDLLPHDLALHVHIRQDGGLNVQVGAVRGTAVGNLCVGVCASKQAGVCEEVVV